MSKIIKNSVQPSKTTKENLHKKLAEDSEYDHELLTGKFLYLEHKGGTFSFMFKTYIEDDYKKYILKDGETYTLPRMVVAHLKNNVHYRRYIELKGFPGVDGVFAAVNDGTLKTDQKMLEVSKDPRCDFIPLDFHENNRMNSERSNIVEIVGSAT